MIHTVYYFVNIDCMLVFFECVVIVAELIFHFTAFTMARFRHRAKLWQSVEVYGWQLFMVALWNRADYYIFMLWFVYGRPM